MFNTTTVTGSGTLNFYWKVSSEQNYDFLYFYIDGTEQDSISGTTDWASQNATIPSGTHTLEWAYSKDDSISNDSDSGWVDKVVWTPDVVNGGTPLPWLQLLLLEGEE